MTKREEERGPLGDHNRLAERFDGHRGHLRAVAYRMLGSLSEAEDAVQDAWLRLSHADASRIDNLGGWLTTVVARLCLDMLRARASRHEQPLGLRPSAPVVDGNGGGDPEQEALLADSVGLALLVVLDRLAPAERVAFVLHDLFAVPFEEIAAIVERSPAATKKLGSRARRRVHGAATRPGADLTRQRQVVEAFLAAARGGDLEALLVLLDPDVVRRADRAALAEGESAELRGAKAVAEETQGNAPRARYARPALVNGAVGIVVAPRGRLLLALTLAVEDQRITEIEVIADPARLARLDLALLDN
jgi:RNA polymerase sigma factor (sigma-70 family)